MFRFHKTLDIITLFHKAGSPASTRVANLLKQVSANSTAGATIDQASDHSHQTAPKREQFELNITEDPPTADQVQTILEYVGKSGIPSIISGARDEKDALKKFKESKESLQRPLVVDWNNGKAFAGDNESEILKLLNAQKQE
ncbi:putative redox protein-like protein [Hapsidospora chrysogenum ATCC 11550]|uniref:Putative redox protein-like protein n=1 Tax=Hapsidospora chrysogenum (strain ATCC 11550 / CBS 779.69 / DSM 880 / IAM 14645 / JCM 23072 / IMI 49137) TaxID=857340 RepID=A0A086TCD9_HAPC1|nr:putative redox protein-like protein [Hapsidospora chrysogenum ATCC 11550]